MFHPIPEKILARMRELERMGEQAKADGKPIEERLLQVPPDTGRFLALMAAGAPQGHLVEVGTSAGYSTLWLSLAGRRITTFEVLDNKLAWSRETFSTAGVAALVEQVQGDAREYLPTINEVALCFLDAAKDIYLDCYEAVVPQLVPGGWLLADNVISHQDELQPMLDRVFDDARVDAVIVPIGSGVLLCRKH